MSRTCDVVVIGGGPAGAAAAIEAARGGLDVCILDEAERPGGQVYRAPTVEPPDNSRGDHDLQHGERLRASLAQSGVEWRGGRRVWTVTGHFRVDAIGPQGNETVFAPRLISATGAHERVVPFPGWTLPGVIGLAAATILLKAEASVPPGPLVIAGVGPLLVSVAARALAAGADIAAVIDLARPGEWLSRLPALATRPALLSEGIGWSLSILRRRVPYHFGHAVVGAEGKGGVEHVVFAPADAAGRPVPGGRERRLGARCLVVGHGLVPGSDVARLLGADHVFSPALGGWVPLVDGDGRTSLPGLWAIGDGAGIKGALPAEIDGAIAGLAAVSDSGGTVDASRLDEFRRRKARSATFAHAMAGLMAARGGSFEAIGQDTVVCRCEDVTRGEIEAAISEGAGEINQIKHFTRCGMGPCQGRMCGEAAATIAANRLGGREAVGCWTPRPPLRPVPLAELVGYYDYDDIPVPEPAPL